jgi:hypothetical protein
VIFGVLTLIVDVGIAHLTQGQMQNAADAASLEGLRNRNLRSDPFEADCKRRSAARNMVSWTFDDDFIPGTDALQLGAGPNMALTGGVGELNAQQTIELVEPLSYKPALQRNQSDNLPHGDMVSGTFDPSQAPAEDDFYARPDFAPSAAVAPGESLLAGCPADDNFAGVPSSGGSPLTDLTDNAFLVRMRRTNNSEDLDEIPDVSSRGNTLPLLFGLGATLQAADGGGGYSVRHDGLTVRATAIAQTRPALRIGGLCLSVTEVPCRTRNPQLEPQFGAVSFAIDRTCWGLSLENASVTSEGTIWTDGCPEAAGRPAGRFVAPGSAWHVASPIVAQTPTAGTIDELGFVAIYECYGGDDVLCTNGIQRVIGFGRAVMCGAPSDPNAPACASPGTIPGPVELGRPVLSVVAVHNASGHLPDGLPSDLTSDEIIQILAANRGLDGAVLVPVLAR